MCRDSMLEVSDVGIEFGGLSALRNVSFEVHPGEVLGLIGPNGAGKSTLLNCVCGIYRPTTGSVRLGKVDLGQLRPDALIAHGVVRTFQETLLVNDISLAENVMLGRTSGRLGELALALLNLRRTRRHFATNLKAVDDVLDALGIAQWRDVPAKSLPYGIRKLTEVARAQFADPTLMLLDEPAAGLGPGDAERLGHHLRALAEGGTSVVLVDHNMDFVTRTAHRIVVLSAGTVLAQGDPDEIRSNPDVIEAYLGSKGEAHA
jgi:ABC-type branched-subunit amino acid transport system ATPase component